MAKGSVYTFEACSPAGVSLADISMLTYERSFTLTRNKEEHLSFKIKLSQLEKYAASINLHPRVLINSYQTDIKVKRNGKYLFGSQVVSTPFSDDEEDGVITVNCRGYLDLFKDRYITATYTGMDSVNMAIAAMTATQAQPRGSVGVTYDSSLYLTGVPRDRTYEQSNVKTLIQDLSKLTDSRFDFSFTHDKKYHTFREIGAIRSDVTYIYGGPGSNITGLYDEDSAMSLYNRILATGSGFGADALRTVRDDVTSQIQHYIRELPKSYSDVSKLATLAQNADADLALGKDVLHIPQLTITGNDMPSNFIIPGDRIPVSTIGHPWLDAINGLYRAESEVVHLDENDFESSIVIYFDNFDVSV